MLFPWIIPLKYYNIVLPSDFKRMSTDCCLQGISNLTLTTQIVKLARRNYESLIVLNEIEYNICKAL
jgi:hypothetical protein